MKNFLETYQILNKNNLHLLRSIYGDNVHFIDPAHEINGLENLTDYFSSMYKNIESIAFDFHDTLQVENHGYVQWDMTFVHKKLAGAQPITVKGVTFLKTDENGKVFYHRDFFDLGAMVYEQVPVLGRLITSIKKRLGK
ncbi:MAG: nuclear transport factor 2 family protein [Desulforhopalus sp.]